MCWGPSSVVWLGQGAEDRGPCWWPLRASLLPATRHREKDGGGRREHGSYGGSWTLGAVRGGRCQGREWRHMKRKDMILSKRASLFSSPAGTMREGMTWSGCPICLLVSTACSASARRLWPPSLLLTSRWFALVSTMWKCLNCLSEMKLFMLAEMHMVFLLDLCILI
jgi:hypothetical protein